MNYLRIGIASVAAFIAYMGAGALMFALLPRIKQEFARYPAVYRDHDGQISHLPVGMVAIFVAILALAVLYARLYRGGPGLTEGTVFGLLIGVFVLGAFVVHNYVNLNIGGTLTVYSAIAYLIEWTIVGVVIGLVYRPA
jgi:hypothetical protein